MKEVTAMTKERFERTGYRMTYEEYILCHCPDCTREKCIHRGAYRRVPECDGGLALCPNLNNK